MDDARIVAAVRAGDRSAVAALYDRYADRLHDYARRRAAVTADADDVVHDVFLIALERIGQLRDPRRLCAWLFAIARTELHRRYRSAARLSDIEPNPGGWREPASPAPGPDALAEQAELVALLREASQGLSGGDRDLLDLHLRHGLVGDDLAAAAGLPAKHASAALDRVRRRLTRTLGVVLLARRPACADFAAIRDAQPALNPLSRKRLARHVDRCPACQAEQSRRLRPEVLLGAVALVPAPPELRDRTLRLAAAGRTAPRQQWQWEPDGFPGQQHRRRPQVRWAAATAGAVLVAAAVFAVLRPPGADPVAADRTNAPAVTTVTAVNPAGPGGAGPGGTATAGPTRSPSAGTSAATSGPPTTGGPDTRPPTIESPIMDSKAISTQFGAGPSCPGLGTTATVQFTVVDVSPTNVTFTWSWSDATSVTSPVLHQGHDYQAIVGPVPDESVPDGDHALKVTITAVDDAGNRESLTTEVGTVYACYVIG